MARPQGSGAEQSGPVSDPAGQSPPRLRRPADALRAKAGVRGGGPIGQ